jgi:hypothetical protein
MVKQPLYDPLGFRVRRDEDVPGFRIGPDGEPVRCSLPATPLNTSGFRVRPDDAVPGFRIGFDAQPPNWPVIGPPPGSLRQEERWVPFYLQIPGEPLPALPPRERQWPIPGWPGKR